MYVIFTLNQKLFKSALIFIFKKWLHNLFYLMLGDEKGVYRLIIIYFKFSISPMKYADLLRFFHINLIEECRLLQLIW